MTSRFRAGGAFFFFSESPALGGDWKTAEPTTRLTDSSEHDYALSLDNVAAGEVTVAVRVTDYYDNQAVEKIVVR